MGTGRLVAPKTLEVRLNDGGTRVLAGDQIFLNVGTHAAIPNIPGLEAARHLTDIEGSGEQKIERSDTLVAAGRTPNTAGIGLEEAGIELDDRGYIRVNDRLETSVSGFLAIGECAGSPQFTHVSVYDFQIVRENLF